MAKSKSKADVPTPIKHLVHHSPGESKHMKASRSHLQRHTTNPPSSARATPGNPNMGQGQGSGK